MYFPTKFQRIKGGASPVLGADTLPAAAAANTTDNLLTFKSDNLSGWPCHRLAVGAVCSVAGAGALPSDLYFFEQNAGVWLRANQSKKWLVMGQTTFFDVISLGPMAPQGGNMAVGSAAAQLLLVVGDPGASAPSGTYTFVMAPDLTTIGEDLPEQIVSARRVRAVTPSDSVDLVDGPCRALWINVAGNVSVLAADDDGTNATAQTFAVAAASVLPVSARRVRATGTTATGITALY